MKKMKTVNGKCVRVRNSYLTKGYEILGYKMILGENYKFEYVGGSYRVHGNWMAEICRTGKPSKTFLVIQPQNIAPYFDGDIIEDMKTRIGAKYVEKWQMN